ncbi:MAG TPA: MBL fold metallo-hydrolase [Candidatus Bathyarchaeia archaeon]|nr:MBL fold metallo-hydrolase [Candidatus Bathyarchaeia archaeon]
MALKFKKLVVGQLATNCYLLWGEKKETLIIDPGDASDFISETILANELKPKIVVATHGHFDHVLAGFALQHTFKIPVAASRKDNFILQYMAKSAQYWLNLKNEPVDPPPEIGRLLVAGDQIPAGKYVFRILETPGHTPGSLCLYCPQGNLVLTGDTLFSGGWGRTDLPGGDEKQLKKSLKLLLGLPPQTQVLPGHGPETTIGKEQEFLKQLLML